jgi:hypothetical protein
MSKHLTSEHGAAWRLLYEELHGFYPVAEPLECEECEQVRQAVLRWEQEAPDYKHSADDDCQFHVYVVD